METRDVNQGTGSVVAGGSLQHMARLRVYVTQGQSERKPMVGYVPRALLDQVRQQMAYAASTRMPHTDVFLDATPIAASRVRVQKAGSAEAEPQQAWQVTVRMRVGVTPRRLAPSGSAPARVQLELAGLLQEAEQVARIKAERGANAEPAVVVEREPENVV